MDQFDRLTTLMDRFRLTVRPAPPEEATLLVVADAARRPERLRFRPLRVGFEVAEGSCVLFAARVEWSGASNPLLAALPEEIDLDVRQDADSMALIVLMGSEIAARRCGADSVLGRLGEVLVVRMLRRQIEAGSTRPGLLAGLSDPRLSRAIVAMHDRPERDWRNEDLARIAGLSLSRFAELFPARVGEPPAAYLRRWRMTLARQDLARGDRVDAVARRYGFASAEGFTRAFRRHQGMTPIALRRAARG